MPVTFPPHTEEHDLDTLEVLLRQRAEQIRTKELDTAYGRISGSDDQIPSGMEDLLAQVSQGIVDELVTALIGHVRASKHDTKTDGGPIDCHQRLNRRAFDLFGLDEPQPPSTASVGTALLKELEVGNPPV